MCAWCVCVVCVSVCGALVCVCVCVCVRLCVYVSVSVSVSRSLSLALWFTHVASMYRDGHASRQACSLLLKDVLGDTSHLFQHMSVIFIHACWIIACCWICCAAI